MKKEYLNQKIIMILKLCLFFFIFFILLNILIPNCIFSIIFGILGISFGFASLMVFAFSQSYLITGVPNNKFKEFDIHPNVIFNNELVFLEVEEGVWILKINQQEYKFDMKKWRKQKKRIYELLFFIVYVYIYNNKEINHRGIFKKIKIKIIKEKYIDFYDLDNKKQRIILINNNILVKNFLIRVRLLNSLPTKGRFLDYRNIFKHKKISLSNFYIFNK